MALADDILALRERILAELTAAHDYYADTRTVWRVAHRLLASGRSVRTRNIVTETITTQADLAARARGYVAVQLAEATFQQFLSIFESFYLDFGGLQDDPGLA